VKHVLSINARPDLDKFHQQLARSNQRRLRPGIPSSDWDTRIREDMEWQLKEGAYVEHELDEVRRTIPGMPTAATAFMAWFELLRDTGPGQDDPLFAWLAEEASLADMRWFLRQEIAGEAGFDDLVALTQVRFPNQAKLELARNYWDEMGQGHERGMHGPMLERTAIDLRLEPHIEDTVWESLSLANVMVALATNRRYAYHSIGALGAVEMTAPPRVRCVNAGLKRLGLSSSTRRYFQLHAGLDIKHSEDWNREIIRPLVVADPELARPIAEGAWLRLQCGSRCFGRYRQELLADTAIETR
jgi:hypothetical protein